MSKLLVGIVLAACILSGPTASLAAGGRKYLGAEKCKMCHKTVTQGEQYGIWSKSAHAAAYASLASEAARAVARERGIEDPQQADECLRCHVTAHDVDAELLGSKYTVTDGVGCESCHGPGGDYVRKKTMVAVTTGKTKGASVGLIKPDEKTCIGCHNEESPFYGGFDFEKMLAKIKHTVPEARKAKYKTASE